jgi:hypothetical protein
MSVPESTPLRRTATESLPALQDAVTSAASLVASPVRWLAFWAAVLLPFAYLPILATGVAVEYPVAFTGLLGANAAAFVLGHAHKRPS